MKPPRWLGALKVLAAVFLLACAGWTHAAELPPPPSAVDGLLDQADRTKTSNHPEFVHTLERLGGIASELKPAQLRYLRYLEAWQVAYAGEYPRAEKLLRAIAEDGADETLRFRATATLVNIFGVGHRYEDAYARVNDLMENLPLINDPRARFQGLGEAVQFLISAGQYETAEGYAEQISRDFPPPDSTCKGMSYVLHARLLSGQMHSVEPRFDKAIEACVEGGEVLFANAIRADIATFYLSQGRPRDAADLLLANYESVRHDDYPNLTSQVDATLAKALWDMGHAEQAAARAQMAVDEGIKGEYTAPLSMALKVLYQAAKKRGDEPQALKFHEQYMAADKAYLDDVSARTLAYQMVKQQVQARKADVEALNKQNEILRLQRALDRKKVETGRLYIFLLLSSLAAGIWVLWRLRRSQLRFMKLARRDGLTGICNREHFVEQAQRVLAYGARSDRGACLILFDLDHFKHVNDTYGHAVGDDVLKRAVDVCRRALHACDVFGRLGGEEFAVLLPDCSAAQARARAEQLRLSIAATSATPSRPGLTVTASFGVASTLHCGFELQRLLVVADNALYRAKRSGRNAVVVADVDDLPEPSYQFSVVEG